MRTVIVLAMPGCPPLNFPKQELAEYLGLGSRLAQSPGGLPTPLGRRYKELGERMRAWPRSPEKDPAYAGAQELAVQLRRSSGRKVILGFCDFGSPSLDDALDQAAGQGAESIVVVTPIINRGQECAEIIIPAAIERAKERHPHDQFIYVWPFSMPEIAEFLNSQLSRRT